MRARHSSREPEAFDPRSSRYSSTCSTSVNQERPMARPAIEQAPGWAENYVRIACDAAEMLWLTRRTAWIGTIERNLRDKVVAPDFRYPMMDGRLALAPLCALQSRRDGAIDWFARARTVLDEQGARPLRAIVDSDEALMYARSAP